MRGWIAVIAIAALIAVAYQGYIPGVSKYFEPLKAQLAAKTSENPKVGYLKNYPVEITYKVDKITKKWKNIWGEEFKQEYYVLSLFFQNTGSESQSFWYDVAIVSKNGVTYRGNIGWGSIKIYPKATETTEIKFDKLPESGKLYVDVYSKPGAKVETVSMLFELNTK